MFTGKNKLLLFSAILLGVFLIFSCGTQPTGSPTPGKTELPVVTSTPTIAPTSTPAVTPSETATTAPTPTAPVFAPPEMLLTAAML